MHSSIKLHSICKEYKSTQFQKKRIIKNISLDIASGKIYGFVGPNGAGKSTTIKIALDLIRAGAGDVNFLGMNNRMPESRSCLGFVPEEPSLYDHLSGLEFLQFSASLADVPKKDRRENALSLLERVGLSHAGKQRLRSYSKGMKQRLVIAQALLGDPDLIIMDEPLSGLDPVGRMEIKELIASIGKQGKTVFFSSHILSDVESICDQVAIIMDGEIKYTGSPENIEHTFREML